MKVGGKHSEETKLKMSLAKKGKRPKNLDALIGSNGLKGNGKWFTCKGCGKEFQSRPELKHVKTTYCTRQCWLDTKPHAGVPRPNLRGEKHFNWKGGITPQNLLIRNSLEAKLWRKAVFERDGYACQTCGLKGRIQAHHIIPFSVNPDKRFDIDNGITLCVEHHKAETKKQWEERILQLAAS